MKTRHAGPLAILLAAGVLGCAAPAQVAQPSAAGAAGVAAGIWLGTLDAGGAKLRIQLRLQAGGQQCALDSLDQQAFGIPCSNVQLSGNTLTLDVPAVNGKFAGQLSNDGQTINGTWTQGGALPLVLTRQKTAVEGPAAKPPKAPDPAMPPVSLDGLQAVLKHDLDGQLTSGALAPETHAGVTIGVIEHGKRLVFCYGTAKPDSIFEIGSISKTFTATILAQMVEQGKVRLDEPVRELLPPGTVSKPESGAEITLLDLSDQHSGLPRMPDNFHPADPSNPYADYDAKALYEYIAKHGVALAPNTPFGYSNLGVGLLGQALANAAKMAYPDLLEAEVTGPLGLRDTGVVLTAAMQTRFIQGYDGEHKPAHAWDLVALAGAGGIRSTADDMLTYLEAQLHPDGLPASAKTEPDGRTLAAAIGMTHEIRADVGGGMHIGLNWFRIDETGSYWHNGGTGGYSSYALFNPGKDFAVIVLSNTTVGPQSITDALGQHIAQRLSGLSAVSLAP
jgi:serine-type D-Ala-D-Ala carboxypeptidase/endopeptidase